MKLKQTKYLLTTTDDKCVVIAEVPQHHKVDDRCEYIVSEGVVKVNTESGNFTEVTGRISWDGRIWVMTSDLA